MKFSPFQLYESDDITGLVTENHLGYRFGIEPQQASKAAIMIHQANAAATINAYLTLNVPIKYYDTQDDFEWDITNNGKANYALTKCEINPGTAITSTSQVGLNYSEFYLYFPTCCFSDQEQIAGERNEVYPIIILENPVNTGGLWRYRCKLNTGNPSLYIPFEELTQGKRFSTEFSPVSSTLSTKGGELHFTFPYKLRNSFSNIRIQNTVPGNMINRPVQFKWIDPKTKKTMTTWMDYRTYEFERQWQEQINLLTIYAQSNKTSSGTYVIKDKSGYEIKMGAGLKQQIEAANYRTWNTFNIRNFTEMLMDFSVGKTLMGQRTLTVTTGEWGMYEFHLAMKEETSLYTPLNVQSMVYMKNDGRMGFKGQFLEFMGPNRIKVNIIHDSIKDDFARNKLLFPGKSGLAESYVFDILNMGTSTGDNANIQKVMLSNGQSEVRGFIPGLRDPFQPNRSASNRIMSTSIDGWTEHRMYIGGAVVWDPTTTGTYKPIILA